MYIIQQLYDAVDLKGMHEECLRTEHRYSIMHDYKFNKYICPLDESKFGDILKMAPKYGNIYKDFVLAMELELKDQLLIRFKLVNEGELFCSDFKYRFTEEKVNDYIGAFGKSNEDTKDDITKTLEEIIKKYRESFREYRHQETEAAYEKHRQEYNDKAHINN